MDAASGEKPPRLHVIFRSHGTENRKARPPYYSKLLALTSFVRAVEALDEPPRVIFWNDGVIPAERLATMRGVGEIVADRHGSNRSSYRAAVDHAVQLPAADHDVVWLAEDDYLYRPDALVQLHAAAAALPDADYLSLYSPGDLAAGRSDPDCPACAWPPGHTEPVHRLGTTGWFRAASTTSTFGIRVRALREDRHLLRLAPYTGGAWDHATCVTVQGLRAYSGEEIRQDLFPYRTTPSAQWPRAVVRGLSRVALGVRSHRRPSRRRTFYASDPLLIWHLERLPDGQAEDPAWASLAAQTWAWARTRGLGEVAAEEAAEEAGAGR